MGCAASSAPVNADMTAADKFYDTKADLSNDWTEGDALGARRRGSSGVLRSRGRNDSRSAASEAG